MDVYQLTVLIHVAAAVALLSASVIASPGVRRAVRRARTAEEVRTSLAVGRPLLVIEPASAMVVLASGIYLSGAVNFWGLGWVQVAIVFWVVNAAVAAALVKPVLGRLTSLAAGSPDGPVRSDLEALRWSPRWSLGGDLLLANDAAMLYLMTMKPDLTGSLIAVAVANLVVAAAGAGLRARRAQAMPGPA